MSVTTPRTQSAADRNTAARVELTDAIETSLGRLRGAMPAPEVVALHVSQVFELVRWHAGRPLFAVRSSDAERAAEPASGAWAEQVPPTSAAIEPPNLIGQIQGLAREVFPIDRGRHRWLIQEMKDLGYADPSIATLSVLPQEDLAVLLRRLRARAAA